MLHDAIAAYQQNGNPHGEASAREALGKTLAGANLGDAGREEYQRAMAIYQSIGDLGGVAATYTDMARILWMAGDRDGSETAARHVLEISRETGDQLLESWSLQALATAASDEAASDEVLRDYREVITLEDKIGNDGGLVWALAAYADTLRLRGDLADADAACRRANGIVSRLSDPQFAIVVAFTCAEVAMDHGDIAAARSGFADAAATAKKSGDALYAANVELALGQIDLGLRDCKSASSHLEHAVHGFAESEATAGEADADALLALCQESLGDTAQRDRAASRARELRTRITERQEVFAVDISLAILRARGGGASEAVSDLRALAADAERRHWLGWSLEAELAMVEALQLQHDPGAATLRAEVVSTARGHGFGWVLTRLGEDRSKAVAARR
jgi:tetratricopeptide (TPR) repeat protein